MRIESDRENPELPCLPACHDLERPLVEHLHVRIDRMRQARVLPGPRGLDRGRIDTVQALGENTERLTAVPLTLEDVLHLILVQQSALDQ